LNCFCLIYALVRTWFSDKIGSRESTLVSTILATICPFLIGALTKVYGTTHDTGVYGTIAMVFPLYGLKPRCCISILQRF
jgi:nitrate/nitrite transporter NarK